MISKPLGSVKIAENTAGPAAVNVATTDENLTVTEMFQQASTKSLGRSIFPVLKMHGPTAAIFNVRNSTSLNALKVNDFELVRAAVDCFPSVAISTGVTHEVIQDIRAQYGMAVNEIVGNLFRGLANDAENVHTLAFLTGSSLVGPSLTLTAAQRADSSATLFHITQRVQELVLRMNMPRHRTFGSYVVLPYAVLASIRSLLTYAGGEFVNDGLFAGSIGDMKFFLNPDAVATDVYVGLLDQDLSKCSAVFGDYTSDVVSGHHPDTGAEHFHIYNRYALAASPLHSPGAEMLHSFTVV